jgi:predicted DNA-binding transcriptional regulator AlpA
MEDRFLRIKEVLDIVGCKVTTWYRLIKQGNAPKPYKPFGKKSSRWKLSEIYSWVRNNNRDN